MSESKAEVVISIGGAVVESRSLPSGSYRIGRDAACEIRLNEGSVSGQHARLHVSPGGVEIEDLGSANGVFIGPMRVAGRAKLKSGEKISLGEALIEVKQGAIGAAELLKGMKYEVGAAVARGGMGAILSAHENSTGRNVAMKVMLEQRDGEELARFIEEAQITAQLEHPNVVPIHELNVNEQGRVFYTMKFVKGVTLLSILQKLETGDIETTRKFQLPALLNIFQKVCDALAFAHSKRVLHRDLKPENIMIGDFGEVLVMDWGLAKILGGSDKPDPKREAFKKAAAVFAKSMGGKPTPVLEIASVPADPHRSVVRLAHRDSDQTQQGMVFGTPQYMAPEQARGEAEKHSERSDIYSLGAILYHLLALRTSVQGDDPWKIIARVGKGKTDPLDVKAKYPHIPGATIPESLAAVVKKAMHWEPEKRYASVRELQADIAAYQNGFATSAENAGLGKQLSLLIKRNKAAAIGIAAALLVLPLFTVNAIIQRNIAVKERATAEATLAKLRGTAPTFAAQAGALVEDVKFDEALEKIAFAISLDPQNADFELFRANTLQAQSKLREAAEAYRRVLSLRASDATAKANLALCEKLLADNGGNPALTAPLKTKLLDAILAQKRQADAVPLSRELKRDTDTAETLIKSRLKSLMAQPGWKAENLKRLPDGTFSLDLWLLKVTDLTLLRGLPISSLRCDVATEIDLRPLQQLPLTALQLGGAKVSDVSQLQGMRLKSLDVSNTRVKELAPLAGMPLKHLNLSSTSVTDLSPLQGMPLEHLDLTNVGNLSDLGPLRGLPLKTLLAPGSGIRDLRPLSESPLESLTVHATKIESLDGIQRLPLRMLSIYRTPVTDLSPLRNSPVKQIWMDQCPGITDLKPLMDCKQLDALIVPLHTSDIAFLKNHPSLKRISNQSIETFLWAASRIPTATEFWAKNGERLARQVPMEKQLEKFRQSLIAQGNDPEKIYRWSFGAEGQLDIGLGKDLKVSDISELRGVAVTKFMAFSSSLRDLSPLAGAPLREITLYPPCGVTDISPLRDAPIEVLYLDVVPVRDISAVRKMPLRMAYLKDCPIADVSPLADVPTLESVLLPPTAKNVETLRNHPKLAMISYGWDPARKCPSRTAAEFWKEFDAKKAAGK